MAIIFMDGFDQYSEGIVYRDTVNYNDLLSFSWVKLPRNKECEIIAEGEIGDKCLRIKDDMKDELRYKLPETKTSLYCFVSFKTEDFNMRGRYYWASICAFNPSRAHLSTFVSMDSDGKLIIGSRRDILWTSPNPVFKKDTWHAVEAKYTVNTVNSNLIVYVDGVQIIDYQIRYLDHIVYVDFAGGDVRDVKAVYYDNIVIRDGTDPDFLPKSTRVYSADIVNDGNCLWTPTYLAKEGDGALNTFKSRLTEFGGVYVLKKIDPSLMFNEDDFTLEAFVKFASFPDAGADMVILAQWFDIQDQDMYKLYFSDGVFKFNCNTKNPISRLTLVSKDTEYAVQEWYHVAVSRYGNDLMLFVNGILQDSEQIAGSIVVDRVSGYNFLSLTCSGGPRARNQMDGYLDEVRITKGFCRYKIDFPVPKEKFPRGKSDPHFDKVLLLIGFDEGLRDESLNDLLVETTYDSDKFPKYASKIVSYESGPIGGEDYCYRALTDYNDLGTLENIKKSAKRLVIVEGKNTDRWGSLTIGAQKYLFEDGKLGKNDVRIGATIEETLINLVSAINGGMGKGTRYESRITPNKDVKARLQDDKTIELEAIIPGETGNEIIINTKGKVFKKRKIKMAGGTGQPVTMDFVLGELPSYVKEVHGVQISTKVERLGNVALHFTRKLTIDKKTKESPDTLLTDDLKWVHDVYDTVPGGGSWATDSLNGAIIAYEQKLIV